MRIADYARLVSQIERGQLPHGFDRLAIDRLMAEICVAPWGSAEERERVQGLVARLFRLSLRLVDKPRRNGARPSGDATSRGTAVLKTAASEFPPPT